MPAIKLIVADGCSIYYAGLQARLMAYPEIESITHSTDGDHLMQCLAQQAVDVVMMESGMTAGGADACQMLQQLYPQVGKIICTSHTGLRRVEAALQAGTRGYLHKDTEATEARIVACIKTVHEGGTSFGKLCTPLVMACLKGQKPQLFSGIQLQILNLLAQGKNSAEIGLQLCKSRHTIDDYRRDMLDKTNTTNTAELIRWASENEYLL